MRYLFFKKLHTYLTNYQSNGATWITFRKNCGEVNNFFLGGGGERGGSPLLTPPLFTLGWLQNPRKLKSAENISKTNKKKNLKLCHCSPILEIRSLHNLRKMVFWIGTNTQTDTHIGGHCDSMTESAQWADSVKIYKHSNSHLLVRWG